MSDTYRGWNINNGHWPAPAWEALGPNYDAWIDDDGEWCDNGEKAYADSREDLIAEIDAKIEEAA